MYTNQHLIGITFMYAIISIVVTNYVSTVVTQSSGRATFFSKVF